ncbi:MAG: XrtA-associated tyrosine autokinase [Burkholderiaceae bacterium]|nr:XrtA-associated tyrosine autokinase [Burkholderiaceae bacterium]
MSLIERAVARLNAEQGAADVSSPPAGPAPSGAERRTSIEAFADRLDAGAADEVAVVEAEPRARGAAPERTMQPVAPHVEREPVRIHLEGLRARGMVVPNGPATQSAHEFRVIKRPLLGNAFGRHGQAPVRNGKRIMVTSAFPGEGKSFTSVNLAMSIAAERDHGVLLIDADVARPTIPRELGIHADVGLMDWLIDGGPDLSQLVLPTNVETLSLLPAGRHDQHATEWLASDAMGRLLDELTKRYPDCVLIFDSPPLLVTTEARVLASYMGQIVMVVESGRTPREAVTQALSTIESNEIVGLVLNKARNIESNGYYQGYGYGYGYGAASSS